MKHNNYKHNYKRKYYESSGDGNHPKHPVRNVFYCILCFFFSLAFSFLWVQELFDIEDVWGYVVIAVLIIICAILGAIVSLRKFLGTQKASALYFKSINNSWHNNGYHR